MNDEPEKVQLETVDVVERNRAALQELFPGVLDDGVLDVQRLSELLDIAPAQVYEGRERYGLQWAGKQEAVRSLLTPSRGSLAPDLERSIDFDTAKNVFIEGDNLEVLKLLQKAYNDRVKLIYIDPPYNTGNDFVYNDDFSDGLRGYLEYTGQLDAEGKMTSTNVDTSGRRHSRWLSMMYPRLMLARNLLRQDGLILVSIDDNEVSALRQVMEQVFGPECFLATLVWDRGHSQQQGQFKEYHEYVIAFCRNRLQLAGFKDAAGGEVVAGAIKKPSGANPVSVFSFPAGVPVEAPDGIEFTGRWGNAEWTEVVEGRFVVKNGLTESPMKLAAAWTQKKQMEEFFGGVSEVFDTRGQRLLSFFFSRTGKLKYRKERTAMTPSTVQRWGTQGASSGALVDFLGGELFDLPKPVGMLQDFVSWATEEDDIVLDVFAGSGTTAHAVAVQNASDGGERRYVLVNLPEALSEGTEAAKSGFGTVADITLARLQKVAENVPGASEMGLRTLRLASSTFAEDAESHDLFSLRETTLATDTPDWDAVAAEVLLKEGVALDEAWDRHSVGDADIVISGGVAVVLSTSIDDQLVEGALDLAPRVAVFLEDGFSGADAVKANAVANARQRNITLKTV